MARGGGAKGGSGRGCALEWPAIERTFVYAVSFQKASLRPKSGGLGTVRCALRRREVAFSRSLQPAAPPDRHRERLQRRRILTAPLHASEFVCDLSVNGSMSRKMWRLRAPRDSRRLLTAVPALVYGEGDPQVIRLESSGQPSRWRKTVSTHALKTTIFKMIAGLLGC